MPRILLLHTGGTLGMAGGRPSALKPASFVKMLKARAPELFQLAEIELELFSKHGFAPVSLGPRVLRGEVAVPAVLGAVRAGTQKE